MCQNALQVISNLIISSIGYCDYCTGRRRLEFFNYLSERFISIFFNMLDSWKWHFWSLLTLKFLCKSPCSKSACPTSFWRPLMLETRGKLLPRSGLTLYVLVLTFVIVCIYIPSACVGWHFLQRCYRCFNFHRQYGKLGLSDDIGTKLAPIFAK